jgi:hypothetical protein
MYVIVDKAWYWAWSIVRHSRNKKQNRVTVTECILHQVTMEHTVRTQLRHYATSRKFAIFISDKANNFQSFQPTFTNNLKRNENRD